MKVLLVNGSPHEKGCTYTALCEIADILHNEYVETEIFHIGKLPISGCLDCKVCEKTEKCIIDDSVNVFLEKAKNADGFIFGSPVHYAGASGAMTSFMDRAFYRKNHIFSNKPVAAIVSCRRSGATAAFDQMNKYFAHANMLIVCSQYWNMVHGNTPEEVQKDLEGLQIMRTLGHNMNWILKCIEAGKNEGVIPKIKEKKIYTNFIR